MTKAPALAAVVPFLADMDAGFGLIEVAPTQERRVAEALANQLPGALVVDPGGLDTVTQPGLVLVAGLPDSDVLRLLNGRRDLLSTSGFRLVFMIPVGGRIGFNDTAPDIAAALVLDEVVPYQSVEGVDPEAALEEYQRWLEKRYGRLDLRGFARSEQEDIAPEVLEIYEEVQLTGQARSGDLVKSMEATLPVLLATWKPLPVVKRPSQPWVILGHPGAGKTFTLRWLALNQDARRSALGDPPPTGLLAPLSAFARRGARGPLLDHLRNDLLRQGLSLAHLLEPLADSGRVLFLLDGLDEGGEQGLRRRIVEAVQALQNRFQRCTVVVTSRVTGFDEAPLEGIQLMMEPLQDGQVQRFLHRWSILYARERLGPTEEARRLGEEEGRRLAEDVLSHPEVKALARTPLLLTVIAMVHRAGVRLPDHRVELYDHATRILVERWNRVRGLASDGRVVPIKATDAVRVLGPVALETVITPQNAAVPEADLRAALARAIDEGQLRIRLTADEALQVFQEELGLLVEQGPGLWGFLHLTLAEYFAAWQLVRTDALERIAGHPVQAFFAQYREVLLLAAGELGVNRADDLRLNRLVGLLIDSASRHPDAATVPSLLGGLVADDPALSIDMAKKLLTFLARECWFSRPYGDWERFAVIRELVDYLGPRILAGRHREVLAAVLRETLCQPLSPTTLQNIALYGAPGVGGLAGLLSQADVDPSPMLLGLIRSGLGARAAVGNAWWWFASGAGELIEVRMPAQLDDWLQRTTPGWGVELLGVTRTAQPHSQPRPWRTPMALRFARDELTEAGLRGWERVLQARAPPLPPGLVLQQGEIGARLLLPT